MEENSKRLPGSEKLTRPEEIGQLSKYLKNIKGSYDESTRLEDQVLGVSGYSTGKIPQIDKLERRVIKTPENQGEKIDLRKRVLNIPDDSKSINKLDDKKLNIPKPNGEKEIDLINNYVKSPNNENDEVTRLENIVKKIQGVRNENRLEEKRLNLDDDRNINLSDKRLILQALINSSLENKRIDLKDDRKTDLTNKRIDLKAEKEIELENVRVNIEDNKKPELEEKKIGLHDERDIILGEKRLDIQDEEIKSLSDKRIDLSEIKNPELNNKTIKLKDDRNISLSSTRVDIKDNQENELEEKRLDLTDSRNISLPKKILTIQDDWNGELEDKKLNLDDDRENRLSDKRLDLEDRRENNLSEKRIDLNDDRENNLSDKRIDLDDDRENSLSDKRLDLEDNRENNLSEKRLDLDDDRENKLSDKRLDLEDDRENKLSDKRLELENDRENNLSEKRLNLDDDREVSLSDKLLELLDERNFELSDKKLNLDDDRSIILEDTRLDLEDKRESALEDNKIEIPENENGEPEELYDAFIGLSENENGEPEELYDQFIGLSENKGGEVDELVDKKINLEDNRDVELGDKLLKVSENKGFSPDLSDIDSIKQYTKTLNDSELYEFAMKIANDGAHASGDTNGWLEKVEGLMSTYLSSDILTPKRAIEFRDAINNTLEMSYFGSKAALRVPIDTSSGTTWAIAEELIGPQLTGTNRRDALEQMIVKLVGYKRENLPRLPGSDIVDAVKGSIKNSIGVITGDTSHPNPMNKPLHMDGMAIPGGYGDSLYQAANNRTSVNINDPMSTDPVGDTVGSTFYERYWKSMSFKATLEELCPIVGKAPVSSLNELKAILKSSPYFSSPGKFMTDTKGSYNTFSLDTNNYWEITFEPFCSSSGSCSNGGFSFLPSIREINFLNKLSHGISTNYGYWVPVNAFELQKTKLSTKSLPLYEGEVAYPTGMEFTNELRLTFVDDAWKSWKRYFERCAEVAVYNSVAHNSNFYRRNIFDYTELTRIDKTNICIASYKNLAFSIKIYILNPQLNLINKFDLLCVLKDFSEEYIGEVDSGGTDLNVSFSIVGENPEEDMAKKLDASKEVISNLAQQTHLELQKRITGNINSSVGLL